MSRWDGEGIYYTKDCEGCRFYRRVMDGDEQIEVCGWGVAFKFLYRREKMKHCDLLRRKQPEYPSIERIEGNMGLVLKTRRIERSKERRIIQLELELK